MKRYVPTQLCMVSYPEIFDPGKGRTTMNKRHNQSVKGSLTKCLRHHQKWDVPKHFQFGAHAKYRYENRSEVTKFIKSKKGLRYLDLVLSGTAKAKFTGPQFKISVGGTTYGGTGAVTATMVITWPPGYYDNPNAKPGAITKAKMRDEIERWTEREQRRIAVLALEFYVEEMQSRIIVGARITKRYDSKLRTQGII